MDLVVPYSKAKDSSEAYEFACKQITPEYVSKFKVKASIDYDEANKAICATGKGFTLKLIFGKYETEVSLKLSLLLKAFKKQILEGVERKLKNHV